MATFYDRGPNFKDIAKRENNFNYSVASLGDIYSPYLTSKQQRQYDILSEDEMRQMGITTGRPNFSYKKYNKPNLPQDPNLKNVSINQVDLGKGLSKNIYLNQGKPAGQLKGHKIVSQRPTSAISTKKIKYNQDLDPGQRNRIIDVNYLHLTKLPESKKFSHVDKAFINPVQSTFTVKNIVDDNIRKHEKMMKPIVLYPDPVRIFNEQPEKILPGSLRRSQEEIEEFEKNQSLKNMMVIGQGSTNKSNRYKTHRDNHVTFNKPKPNRFKRKATSTKAARNTLRDSENFVELLDNYFMSSDMRIPPEKDINVILKDYAEKLENSLNKYEMEISGKKKMNSDTSKFLFQDGFKNKKRSKFGQKVIKPHEPKIYPEFDYEFRKKIQERTSTLQINLRQIFDNISILKKNKTKENVKKIREQIKKARELTDKVRHLADDVNLAESDFKNSMIRSNSSPKKKKTNFNQDLNMNNSFNNTSYNSTNAFPQNNTSYYRTMNNPSNPPVNVVNNNVTNNNLNISNQSMNSVTFPNTQNNVINNNTTNNLNNTVNSNMNNTNSGFPIQNNSNMNNTNSGFPIQNNSNMNDTNNSNYGYPNQNNNNMNSTNNTNYGYPNQNNNMNNSNNNPNNAPTTTTKLQNQQTENPLEYSSTSISSNINPMNSFSTNVNNISTVQQTNQSHNNINIINNTMPQTNIHTTNNIIYNNNTTQSQAQPQPMPQANNMMTSRANMYMQSQNFNPIIEDPNEYTNNNVNTRSVNTNMSQGFNSNIQTNRMPTNMSGTYNNQTNPLPNTQRLPNQSINKNSNYFLQSTNTFKDINSKSTTNINVKPKSNLKPKPRPNSSTKTKTSFKVNPNNNSLTKSKMITVSLDEPEYFRNKPKNSQTFRGTTSISLINPKSSEVLTQNYVINDMDQTINHVPMQVEEMKVNTKNYVEDERYSSFNVEFPVKYYYELSKEHEPPKNKEWFIRPHHTETFVESNNAIPDDIMNTKYLSYYAPAPQKKKKTRQDILEELIMETRAHISELQEDMFKKANLNKEGEKLYGKLEDLREEAKKSFIPGYRDAKEAKQKSIFEMLKDPNSASYSEMYDQNEDIKQTNFAISSVGTMLSELRGKEKNIINKKRKEEYERIRPPVDGWYELKSDAFLNEIIRNKMVLNSGPEYFEKIEELQNEELY